MAESKISAFLHDDQSRQAAQQLQRITNVQRGTVRNAAWTYRTDRSPDILLVDLDGEQNPIVYVPALMQVCRPESMVLMTGSENNVALANELYRSGVFLYLPKPLTAESLTRSIGEIDAAMDDGGRADAQAGGLLTVLGKGMGVNTITALMARLAASAGRYVSCLDLDPNFSTLSLALDTDVRRGLAQAMQSDSIDAAALERLQAPVSQRIGLVAHTVDQAGQDTFSESGLQGLVETLAAQSHVIMACGLAPPHVGTLQSWISSHIIVYEPTEAGVSVAARWLRILKDAPSALVLNRSRPLAETMVMDRERMRDALEGREPDLEIPYMKRMVRAMSLGEPEKAVSRTVRTAIGRFLAPLMGADDTAKAA